MKKIQIEQINTDITLSSYLEEPILGKEFIEPTQCSYMYYENIEKEDNE